MTAELIWAIKLALAAFLVVLAVRRDWWLSREMFRRRGPRSDTPCMSRRELLRASADYLKLAVLLCAAALLAMWIGEDAIAGGSTVGSVLFGAFFFVFLFTMMALLAAAYTFVRGLFRSPDYVPPARCRQCTPEWEGHGERPPAGDPPLPS